MTKPRTLAAIAASAAVALALTGCGSDDQKKASADLPAASSSSPSTPSASDTEAGDDTVDTPASGTALTKDNFISTMLASMREKKTAHMEMELGSSMSATADVRYADEATEMDMRMSMGSQEQHIIITDGAMYMQQPGGSKFLKIDSSDPAMGSLLDQMKSMGPESSVKAMEAGLQKIDDKGEETVDGEKLHHYQVTVDASKAADNLSGLGSAGGKLPKKMTYDMWVDGDNLMRRVELTAMGQKIVMKVTKWGEPVNIKAPAAGDVVSK